MTSDPFAGFLERQGFVLLDGGFATALEALGENLDDSLWSARALLDSPERVREVHRAYLGAGADCIQTATYQATFEGLARRRLGEVQAEEVLLHAVRFAVEERDAFWAVPVHRAGRLRPLVAASVGPYGAYLADGSEYTGRYALDEEGLLAFHRRRWEVLAASPADLLACETIPCAAEARALARLLASSPGRWAWISFQCRDARHLADGTPLADAVAMLEGAERLAAVGVNCVSPEHVPGLLAEARRTTRRPIVVYPNSGERWDAAAKRWTAAADHDLARAAPHWRAAGASIIGGCCRTGPETISGMRRALLAR